MLRRCPGPGCEKIIKYIPEDGSTKGTVGPVTCACTCGYSFCFTCGMLGGHAPLSCELAQKWQVYSENPIENIEEKKKEELKGPPFVSVTCCV